MFIINPLISSFMQAVIVVLAVIAVGVADVMLKRAASHGTLLGVLYSP